MITDFRLNKNSNIQVKADVDGATLLHLQTTVRMENTDIK